MDHNRQSRSVRKMMVVGLALFCGWILLPTAEDAHALPCTNSDTVCSMNFWNVSPLNSSGDVVNVRLGGVSSGLYTTLTFQWVSGNAVPPSGIGIDQIGWTGTVGVASSGCAEGWTCNLGVQNMAGFGTFRQFEKEPGGMGGIAPDSVTFTLARGVAGFSSFALNNHNAQFAAHVRYSGGCSGFVSNGSTTSIGSNASCTSQIPEPSALLLLGAGILAMAGWRGAASALKRPSL